MALMPCEAAADRLGTAFLTTVPRPTPPTGDVMIPACLRIRLALAAPLAALSVSVTTSLRGGAGWK